MSTGRSIRTHVHDDGVNAWRSTALAPAAGLAGHVFGYSDYWERTGGFATRRELPHAEGVMIVNLGAPIAITGGDGAVIRLHAGEAFIAGVHLRPALSHSDGAQAGIHIFLPLVTLRRLLGVPMGELIDRVVRLDDLLGSAARDLCARLLEARDAEGRAALLDAALIRRLAETAPLDLRQHHAIAALRHRPVDDIAAIARDIGWSRKHLADRVRDAVGVGPRCFRRLLRFQALTAMVRTDAGEPDWAGIAHDAGYCDQSHMIREFREFAGMTPGAFVARSLPDGGGLIEG
ncbi:helix-turn-helix domain-containing protein [Sphingomonas crocodyli]|uniref:AraC family transcriptional regulator n=1 Tax=Sphingomonas crocodyli TaxID=1979270 RepID=A0A437M9U2_9SPHN|nr:AraC family transcriptional regulator [Sphingomonas crocodyli]RVT94397.1 AraC family transcriptional regulator [Sphingomonas crocodyli]